MKKVFVLISDINYLEHAKSLFFAARNTGKWDGDLCLIANKVDDSILNDFKKFGVEIIHNDEESYYYANFFIFDYYMKKWDYVIYMDCDFTIFDDLNSIVEEEISKMPILSVDIEPFKIHEYLCQGWNKTKKDEALVELYKEYDLNKNGFNTGFMSFNTSLITKNTLKDLIEMSNKIDNVNNHNQSHNPVKSDLPVFNLYFIDKLYYIKNNKVSYWKNSNDNTIVQHHCRWDAPWKNTSHSNKLGKTYLQNYQENLNSFYASTNKL